MRKGVVTRPYVLDQHRPRLGAIRPPKLLSVSAVVGDEEQRSPHIYQAGDAVQVLAGIDVLDQHGPRLGAIRPPKLPTVGAVVGGEEQRAPHISQVVGPVLVGATGMNVLDQDRACPSAVRPPQLLTMGAVVGDEEHGPPHIYQVAGVGVGVAGMDVLDQDCARPGAVRLPQLLTVNAVVGGEEQRPPDIDQAGGAVGIVARNDVLDQDSARPGAIRFPQLRTVGAVVGREEQRPTHTGQEARRVVVAAATSWYHVLDQDRARPSAVRPPQLLTMDAVVGGEEQPARYIDKIGGHARRGVRVALQQRGTGASRVGLDGPRYVGAGHRARGRTRPVKVTAAAIAAEAPRPGRAPRARRRSTFARATRDRTDFSLTRRSR